MKKYYTLLLFLFLYSCTNEKTEKFYYPNGNLKSIKTTFKDSNLSIIEDYDNEGNIVLKGFYNKKIKDSSYRFNKNKTFKFKRYFKGNGTKSIEYDINGNLVKSGVYIFDTIKVGWWNYYKNNKIQAKRQYEIVCENYYLNQSIIFNNKYDTIFMVDNLKGSTYFRLKKEKKDRGFVLNYIIHPISKKSKLELIFLKRKAFCVEDFDTIIQLKSSKGSLLLNQKFSSKMGIIFDYYIDDSTKTPYNMRHNKKYFDLAKY